MSFAYTTTLGVFAVAAMMQLSVLQGTPDLLPSVDQVKWSVSQWYNRTAGEDHLISEDEMRSDDAKEEREDYMRRVNGMDEFRSCWFDESDTNGNKVWDEEERMKVFDKFAGEDRQMSLEEAYSFAEKHYKTVLPCYRDMIKTREEEKQRMDQVKEDSNAEN